MYNNYGYNPYYPQQRYQGVDTNNQQPMMTTYQQPMQLAKPSGLLGKSVDNIDVVKATDIPLDGSISYFPLTDGSAIVSKQLQMDGTSKMVVYKPAKANSKRNMENNYWALRKAKFDKSIAECKVLSKSSSELGVCFSRVANLERNKNAQRDNAKYEKNMDLNTEIRDGGYWWY